MIAKNKKTEKRKLRVVEEVLFFVVGCLIGTALLLTVLWFTTRETILPGVKVAGEELGGESVATAINRLENRANDYSVELTFNGSRWRLPKEYYSLEIAAGAQKALRTGKEWDWNSWQTLLTGSVDIPLEVKINEEKYASWSAEIESSVTIVPQPALVEIKGGKVAVTNGEDGLVINREELRKAIVQRLTTLEEKEIQIPVSARPAALSDAEQTLLADTAEKLVDKQLVVLIDEDKDSLLGRELISFLAVEPDNIGEINERIVGEYVVGLKERFDRQPQDAKFEFAEGRVQEFAPGRDGIEIEVSDNVKSVAEGVKGMLGEDKTVAEVRLALKRTPPQISTNEVNNLGINERIGRGESYYAHSIANRIYNVGLASARVSGALVAPGEEFSFNKFVGEISGATGYKTAYVISGGRTVLGDGGGVCQVSTTLFRAVMDAGLPITERWAHAYRVGYYEQNSDPGKDATVYAPSKDFKFVNDTGNHILIQATNDPKNLHLVFEIYGTSDGRISNVTKSKVWGVTPPPPDLYEDDPNLPAGTIKQVDWSAWGAKTSFDYSVTRNGETIFEKTYNSNYRAWQNVFIRGTGEM